MFIIHEFNILLSYNLNDKYYDLNTQMSKLIMEFSK